MRRIFFPLLLGALLFNSCKKDKTIDCPPKDLRNISFGFETNLLDWQLLGGDVELKDSTFFEISTDTSVTGASSGKFIVSQSGNINGGVRSELSFDQHIENGDITTYEYSFLIPSDYQDVSSLKALDGSTNWQIVGQWHDQPDECLGETWATFASNSPPIALYYNFLSTSDLEYQNILNDPELSNIYGFDPNWDNVSVIGLEFAGNSIAIAQINKGQWYKMKYEIKWSPNGDGYVQAWINGNPFTNGKVSGVSMNNNASHYFKFGMYRNPDITFINSIYYDDIIIY